MAINLGGSSIARARAQGFHVDAPSTLTYLQSVVTRLVPPDGMDVLAARTLLQADSPDENFALNRIYRLYRPQGTGEAERSAPAGHNGADACKDDRCVPRNAIQWQDHLQACSKGLRIGVIDTDVDHQHPAFSEGRLKIGNFLPEGRSPAPNWHGTGVLALLAGSKRSGTPGLIPNAEFYVANVFFSDDAGNFATDTVSLLKAFDWIGAYDVKIVNMSFAGPRDDLVQKAIAKLSANGVVFVAAAGNEGPAAAPSYPAAYKQVVAVTAVNKDMRNYPMANRGEHIDVAAPGVDIWTAIPGKKEGYRSGTSFAAPYATAMLATILPKTKLRQKEQLLKLFEMVDLGPPGRDPIYGRGLLIAPRTCSPEIATAKTPSVQAQPARANNAASTVATEDAAMPAAAGAIR